MKKTDLSILDRQNLLQLPSVFFEIQKLWYLLEHLEIRTAIQMQIVFKKVKVGKDQEKAQSEKDSHSKNGGGKKTN